MKLSGLWEGIAKPNVERSFAYFSYSFTNNYTTDQHINTIWLMGALDAFYCDTTVGISEKLKKRVPLFIKDLDPETLKRCVNKIYSDRSRLFHGDLKFRANYGNPYDESDEYFIIHNSFSSKPNLLYILIASYQHCVRNNIYSVEFVERAKVLLP